MLPRPTTTLICFRFSWNAWRGLGVGAGVVGTRRPRLTGRRSLIRSWLVHAQPFPSLASSSFNRVTRNSAAVH